MEAVGPLGMPVHALYALVASVGMVAVWLVLTVAALLKLRHHEAGETARVLWALLIVLVPVLGAVAYFLVSPSNRREEPRAAA